MKALFLAAGVAAAVAPLNPASAAVYTLGGPLAQNCYESAVSRDGRAFAIEGCTRALNEEGLLTPDRAATYVNRGIVFMVAGRAKQADADFDQALALDSNLSDAWLNKGFLRIKDGKGQEALPLLQKGIDHGARRQALAYFARGVAYEQAGDFSSAYRDLVRARQLEPAWGLPNEWLAHYRVGNR
jgi:tetratricopeptide (TPR) repeat protein